MNPYQDYLPELRSTTLFQDMADDDILALLDAMQPTLLHVCAGECMPLIEKGHFRMFLRTVPAQPLAARAFKYDMPQFGEPGMLMHEIPALSRLGDTLDGRATGHEPPIHPPHPLPYDADILDFTETAMTTFYSSALAAAQGQLLRNFLGILAQKVCDVRHELFLMRDGRDLFMERDKTLQIFADETARETVLAAVQRWNLSQPAHLAELHSGKAEALAERLRGGARCDLFVSVRSAFVGGTALKPGVTLPEKALFSADAVAFVRAVLSEGV